MATANNTSITKALEDVKKPINKSETENSNLHKRDIDIAEEITIIGVKNCPWTEKAIKLLNEVQQPYKYVELNAAWQRTLLITHNTKRIPAIFIGNKYFGSYAELSNYLSASFISDKILYGV